MRIEKTALLYFSPTHTTQKTVRAIGAGTALPVTEYNFTHLSAAPRTPVFGSGELVIIGLPVYMGRVPFAANDYLRTLRSEGSPCVLVALYGNRAFDDFLVELEDIVTEQGFVPVAAAAFLGEHSITGLLATGRPNAEDVALAERFGRDIVEKLRATPEMPSLPIGAVPGNRPYATYSASRNGKATTEKLANGPTVDETCTNCKACVAVCPIDNINPDDVRDINPYECIRCHACVRTCPAGAIRFMKPGFLRHVKELEDQFASVNRDPILVL